MKKGKLKKMITLALSVAILSGGLLTSSIVSKADGNHLANCNQILYYTRTGDEHPSYTHASQYGVCTVEVTTCYNYYICHCGAVQEKRLVSRQEHHSRPHG